MKPSIDVDKLKKLMVEGLDQDDRRMLLWIIADRKQLPIDIAFQCEMVRDLNPSQEEVERLLEKFRRMVGRASVK